jgi:hypothetical protein
METSAQKLSEIKKSSNREKTSKTQSNSRIAVIKKEESLISPSLES